MKKKLSIHVLNALENELVKGRTVYNSLNIMFSFLVKRNFRTEEIKQKTKYLIKIYSEDLLEMFKEQKLVFDMLKFAQMINKKDHSLK